MNYTDLSPELKERMKACRTTEELRRLVEAEGYELSPNELASVAASMAWSNDCVGHA